MTKVKDNLGNFYTIAYAELPETGTSKEEVYPVSIEYTGHEHTVTHGYVVDMQPYVKISFAYTERTDKNTAYLSGAKIQSTLLLSDIRVSYEDQLIRKYSFKYSLGIFSRLSEIQLYEDKDVTINTTKIHWEDISNNEFNSKPYWDMLGSANQNDNMIIQIPANFNFDQKTDIAQISVSAVNGHHYISAIPMNATDPVGRVSETLTGYANTAITGDFYGSGYESVLIVQNTNSYGKSETDTTSKAELDRYFYLYTPRFSSNDFEVDLVLTHKYHDFLNTGDFDGNGKMDILFEWHDKLYFYKIENNGATELYPTLSINDIEDVRIADFTGDGVSDILVISDDDDGGNLQLFDGLTRQKIFNSNSMIQDNDEFDIGDFNGDGKADFLWESAYDKRKLYLSTGNIFNHATTFTVGDGEYTWTGDYDGNGTTDLVTLEDPDMFEVLYFSGNLEYKFYVYSGNSFVKKSQGIAPADSDHRFKVKKFRKNFDFNGDGKQELFGNMVDVFGSPRFGHLIRVC